MSWRLASPTAAQQPTSRCAPPCVHFNGRHRGRERCGHATGQWGGRARSSFAMPTSSYSWASFALRVGKGESGERAEPNQCCADTVTPEILL
eukprot:366119-Chlamydomonas_euryale.AAC.34